MKNMSDENFDILIRIAAIRSIYKTAEKDMNEDYSYVVPNPRIDRKMHKMIRTYNRKQRNAKAKIIWTRIAAAILILMSICTLTIIGNSRFRNAIWDVIVDWSDDHVSIRYGEGGTPVLPPPNTTTETEPADTVDTTDTTDTDTPETTGEGETTSTPEIVAPVEILNYKKPTALPDGVEEEEVLKNKAKYAIDYYIGDDLYLSYSQAILDQNVNSFDDTDLTIKSIAINGCDGVLLISNGSARNKLTWSDGLYDYILSGYLSEDEFVAIAESIS